MTTKKGVWNLQQVRDKQLQDLWSYTTDGDALRLFAWGGNTFGELYLAGITGGAPAKRSSPVQIPGTNWKDLSNISGKPPYTSFASKTDGTLWSWGRNQQGTMGNNSITSISSPVQIPGTNWTGTYDTMSGSYFTSTAIKTDGTLWSWGYNSWGQLGQNQQAPSYATPDGISSPTQVGSFTDCTKLAMWSSNMSYIRNP